jgi:amino acid transporter
VSCAGMILLNYVGLDIVGRSAEVITVLTLLPFLALFLLAIPHMQPSNWLQVKPLGEVDWINYFNIMFWSLNSWDSVSTLAGEVRDPSRMLPKALFFSVQLVRSHPPAAASFPYPLSPAFLYCTLQADALAALPSDCLLCCVERASPRQAASTKACCSLYLRQFLLHRSWSHEVG